MITHRMALMLVVPMMLVSAAAFAAPSPHTRAVLDGTLHKSDDGKSYVLHVDSAKTHDGKDMPEMNGKKISMPGDMSKDMTAACAAHCEKPIQVTCCMEEGTIAAVSGLTDKEPAKSETGIRGLN